MGGEPICRMLPVAPSTYHDHVIKRGDLSQPSECVRRDSAPTVEVRRGFKENFRAYGVGRVWRQLQREGFGMARFMSETV